MRLFPDQASNSKTLGCADKVRSAADRIRERVKKTVEDIIEVGNDLLAVKEALPHGQFLPWLRAEFGWSERSAQNFMSVAEQFKSAKIADLPIQPSAAFRLWRELSRHEGWVTTATVCDTDGGF